MRQQLAWAVGTTLTAAILLASPGEQRRIGYRGTVLVQLAVSDLDESIRFYTEVLEFKLEEHRPDLEWARVKPGIEGVTIGLSRQPEVKGSGTLSLNFGVVDLDRVRAILESRDVVFDGPTIEVPGVVRLADFKDPDGNRIRLAGDPDGVER
ncbi:MAG: VOC family protein [Acidobacteria bacterium]|nr:VOC family protein [Acidobacteriota bacterium]